MTKKVTKRKTEPPSCSRSIECTTTFQITDQSLYSLSSLYNNSSIISDGDPRSPKETTCDLLLHLNPDPSRRQSFAAGQMPIIVIDANRSLISCCFCSIAISYRRSASILRAA